MHRQILCALLAVGVLAGCVSSSKYDDPCDPNPCTGPNKTICLKDAENQAVCSCDEAYTDYGDGQCLPEDPCAEHDRCAAQHRQCTNERGVATCAGCIDGYHGQGESCVPDETCSAEACSGHGECDDSSGAVVCTCQSAYRGPRCDTCAAGYHQLDDACVPDEVCGEHTCSGHGDCDNATGEVTCTCHQGYAGEHCEACDEAGGFHRNAAADACTDDPCDPNPCDAALEECSETGACTCRWQACGTACCAEGHMCRMDSTCGSLTAITAGQAAEADSDFGRSVGISGEYATIGAYRRNGTGDESGAAHLFKASPSGWQPLLTLRSPNEKENSWFGRSVAMDGEWAIVGAPNDDGGGANAGQAYLYHRTRTTWDETAVQLSAGAQATDWAFFGSTVDISGDRALVGAYRANVDAVARAGAAYAFEYDRAKMAWGTGVQLTAGDHLHEDAWFGSALAIDGDRAAVGAPYDPDAGGTKVGAVYVFENLAGTWAPGTRVVAADPPSLEDDVFGASLALDGDTLMVGAFNNDAAGEDAGAVYVFQRTGDGDWEQRQRLLASDAAPGDIFGMAFALAGDVALIGARHRAGGPEGELAEAGAVYVFRRAAGEWTERGLIVAPEPGEYAWFGAALDTDGSRALIGVPFDDVQGVDCGAAFEF